MHSHAVHHHLFNRYIAHRRFASKLKMTVIAIINKHYIPATHKKTPPQGRVLVLSLRIKSQLRNRFGQLYCL